MEMSRHFMSQTKLWTRDFIILAGINFFVAIIFYLLMTSLSLYAVEKFQASESKAGILTGIFIIGSLVARLCTGRYIDLIGKKKLIIFGSLLFLVMMMMYIPIQSYIVLLSVRFIQGMAFGALTTGISTSIISMIAAERRGEGMGYFSLSTTLAAAIGPFMAIYLQQFNNYQLIFTLCTICTAFTLVLSLIVRIPMIELSEEQKRVIRQGYSLSSFLEKSAIPLAILMVLLGVSYAGIVTFIAAYAKELQLSSAASYFFMVYAGVLLISRPLAGKLLDKKGENIVMYPAIIIYLFSFIMLSNVQSGFFLLLSGGLIALGYGTLMSSAQVVVVKKVEKYRMGMATSTFFLGMDLGMGIGPTVTGQLIVWFDYRTMYAILAGLVGLSFIYYYFVHGRSADKPVPAMSNKYSSRKATS